MVQIEKRIEHFVAQGKPLEDGFRPGVRVDVISGRVVDIREKNGATNVIFKVEGLEHEFNGFISRNEMVFKLLEKAFKDEKPVVARLERKRNKKQDPHADIMELTKTMELAKQNAVKITVGVYNFNTNEWVLTGEAESVPSEDPASVMNGIHSVRQSVEGFFESPQATSTPQPRVNGPREHSNKTDSLVNFYFFVIEHMRKANVKINNSLAQEMAKLLLLSCDRIQMDVFNLAAPVYSDYSYTRARYLLFSYTDHINPLTVEQLNDIEQFKAWAKHFISFGGSVWKWADKTASPEN